MTKNNTLLPGLTSKEASRLREIAKCETDPFAADLSPNSHRTSTAELIKIGYVVVEGRHVAASGRVMKAGECRITERGRLWLNQFNTTLS